MSYVYVHKPTPHFLVHNFKRMDFNGANGDHTLFPNPNPTPKLTALTPYLSSFGPSQFQFEFKSGGGSESSVDAPKPLECLHKAPIPPFLSKTYDLVDDPSLDAAISWGEKGDTFVVWNPPEFSKLILPRNFKHSNFSSFVRQLNTYGFRKIGTEKWEFMNEGFVKGQRHLLRRIQRRKSLQPEQVGSSIETGKAAMEAELECLQKERSSLKQELVQLQHQQCNTTQHVEVVKERLEDAEKTQKQMVSFVAKMLQKPAFLACIKQAKKQKSFDSHRPARKYVKHEPYEPGTSSQGQFAMFQPQACNFIVPSVTPDYDVGDGLIFGADHVPSWVEGIAQDGMAMVHGLSHMPKQGESVPTLATIDSSIKQEDAMIPEPQSLNEHSASFPGDLIMEKSISEFPIGAESIAIPDAWGMQCETGVGMSSLWDNLSNNDPLELGNSSGLTDIWGIGSQPSSGNLGFERWLDED